MYPQGILTDGTKYLDGRIMLGQSNAVSSTLNITSMMNNLITGTDSLGQMIVQPLTTLNYIVSNTPCLFYANTMSIITANNYCTPNYTTILIN